MKRILFSLLVLIVLAVFLTSLRVFVIGEPANVDSLAVHVSEDDGQLTIYIQTMDSAMAISNVQYRIEDTTLHLTVRKVLCSPLYRSGEKSIYYEITGETTAYLNGKQIWKK